MNRTLKDTLVISFAPACKGTDCNEATTEDFSLAADELSAESSESEASLHKNIQALTEQLDELKIPAHVTEVQRASLETTQALIRSTLTLTQAVSVLKQQSQDQSQRFSKTLRAVTPAPAPNAQAAARAAQDNNTRMILQNLLTSP